MIYKRTKKLHQQKYVESETAPTLATGLKQQHKQKDINILQTAKSYHCKKKEKKSKSRNIKSQSSAKKKKNGKG